MAARAVFLVAAVAFTPGTYASAMLAQGTPPAASGQGQIRGRVGDIDGVAIGGVNVTRSESISGGAATGVVTTSQDGTFRLNGVPAGGQVLVARRLGFRPESLTVNVVPDSVTEAFFRLQPVSYRLEPTVISAARPVFSGPLRRFYERREQGAGHFFTAEDIAERNPRRVSDLLRTIPGTRITQQRGQSMITFRGQRCAPLVWLDGMPAGAGYFDPDVLPPRTLAGIEVYTSRNTTPVDLMGSRETGACGVIVLWSTPPPPRTQPRVGRTVTAEELAAMVASVQLFTQDDVDVPAVARSAVIPVYPDSLLAARVAGRATVEFVVDTLGLPYMETFGGVISTHRGFTDAVRASVAATRFTPALRAGRPVRQLVQLSFEFVPPP